MAYKVVTGFLYVANAILHIAHIGLIVMVVAGWWFCETRLLSDLLIAGTLFSWYGLKRIFTKDSEYGYCVITDLQWRVRKKLGLATPQNGYMKYLSDKLPGADISNDTIEKTTKYLFFISIFGAAITSATFGLCLQ